MTIYRRLKYCLYTALGRFRYFGFWVSFPKNSAAFRFTWEQGVFEKENVHLLSCVCTSDCVMFDVGAHLGLMALPILRLAPAARVVSFEPSQNALPWLRKTVERSRCASRWTLVEKAVGAAPSTSAFSLSRVGEGVYDGLKNTGRVPEAFSGQVEVTTLDQEWESLGRPRVSVIKIDVEGGELNVLLGAQRCLAETRPVVLLEWSRLNLPAYGVSYDALLEFAAMHEYNVCAIPGMHPVTTALELKLQMLCTESYLMVPRGWEHADLSGRAGHSVNGTPCANGSPKEVAAESR